MKNRRTTSAVALVLLVAVSAASVSPFDSHVGTLALFNLLVGQTAERLKESAADRLERVEAAWAEGRALIEG